MYLCMYVSMYVCMYIHSWDSMVVLFSEIKEIKYNLCLLGLGNLLLCFKMLYYRYACYLKININIVLHLKITQRAGGN